MIKILVFENRVSNLRLISYGLRARGYQIQYINDGSSLLQINKTNSPDLILVDSDNLDQEDYLIFKQLQLVRQTKDILTIFFSEVHNALDKVRAFEMGIADYITRPFDIEEVLVRIEKQLELKSSRLKINQLNQQLEQKVKDRTAQLEVANQKLMLEVQKRKKIERQLVHDVFHDSLTGLASRNLLMEKIEHSLKQAKRNPNYLLALLFIDLDRFKVINDSLGHLVGDQLIIKVAKLLTQGLRETDLVARLGGDEFVILLSDVHDITAATKVADRIQAQLRSPFKTDNQDIFTSASIGIVLNSIKYQNSSQMLRDADIAMYRAKAKGKARYEVFDQAMYTETLRITELERNLRLALERNELELYYQPIIFLANKMLMGFEALIRWNHPQLGSISPTEFIPIAEDTGMISAIGDWVLTQACRQMMIWQRQFQAFSVASSWKMSVNIASQQLQEPSFIAKLDQLLHENQLDGSCLRLEITERVLVDSGLATQNTLSEIKQRKIKLSIDDFGTGYSSLSYLRRLPIDHLKIDKTFVDNIDSDLESREIVKTIITLANTLKMDTIAEGIEKIQQLKCLKNLGCEYAQGYLFAKPLSSQTITAKLEKSFACRQTPRQILLQPSQPSINKRTV